jgi:hypothetical protein
LDRSSADELVHESITNPVVSVSALT